MRRLFAAMLLIFASILQGSPRTFFLLGNCTLPLDPDTDKNQIQSSFFLCQKGDAEIGILYIPKKTVGTLTRFDLRGSAHYGNKHGLFYEVYFEQMGKSGTDIPFSRNFIIDTVAYQFGNPSIDNFRVLIGQQRPAFGINRYPDLGFRQFIDPRYVWGFPQTGIDVIYDNQKASQMEIGWIPSDHTNLLRDRPKDHWFTARFMHDFTLSGSTRVALSAMFKKSAEKRVSFGFVSHGSNENRFQAEWVRSYSSLPGSFGGIAESSVKGSVLNSPYTQLIRFAYEDPPRQKVRFNVLFDDLSFQYRLFGLGLSFDVIKHTGIMRFLVAFRQDRSGEKKHRWLLGTGIGFQL